MNIKNRSTKNINLNKLKSFINNFKFKSINLTFSKQLVLLWCIIWFTSLFLPWIIDIDKSTYKNSFNSLSWNIWFLLIIIFFITIFISLSTNYKEKLKLYSDLSFKNHFIIITSWIFIICLSIITLSFINWLHTLFENKIYWNWIILCMTSWIIILSWWLMIRNEFNSESSEIILNKFNENRDKIKEKDNMKLPF